ncbi:DUF6701 domain-containing protein [Vibrio algivorus]|uniref:DUF6701 domain-containing protein n=1 Tax=Vibrio algivorus TaxID=1667024 RepID=A0A557PD86_9VIBR|nr:DUF6701 domain-containing protein [Vibrio algivorus]TVO38630.1 hypothetical protein FOF44_04670 [Vibrio algivorus]
MRHWFRIIFFIFMCIPLSVWAADQCSTFPASIQSWSTSSTITLGGNTPITGTYQASGRIAFGQVIDDAEYKKFCDGQTCVADTSLLIDEPAVINTQFGGNDFIAGSSRTVEVPEGNYDTMRLGSGKTFNFTGSEYHIKTLIIGGGATINLPNKTLIVVNTASLGGGATINVKDDSAGNLTIWAEDSGSSKADIVINLSNILNGAIFSRSDAYVGGSAGVLGAITAHDLVLNGSASSTYSSEVCTEPDQPDSGTDIDLCEYFPEPAQSWKSNSTLSINNNDQQIIGWSDNYLSSHLYQASDTTGNGAADTISSEKCTSGDPNCVLEVGFDNITELGQKFSNMACEDGACYSGGEKIEVPPAITPEFTSSKEITIDDWASRDQCIEGGVTYCTVADNGSGSYTITILKSLKSLTVNAWSSANFDIEFVSDEDDEQYGLKIETVTLAGQTANLTAHFIGDGRFSFGSALITSGQISATGEVILFLTQGLTVTNPFLSAMNDGDSDFIIYGPEANVEFSGDGQEMKLKILADSVTFNNSAAIYGAVTANTLYLSEPNTYIIADKGMCATVPTDDSYDISMLPDIDYSLTCGTDQPEFTITTQKNGEPTSLGVNAEILPTGNNDDFEVSVQNSAGSGTFPSFLSDSNGELDLSIAIVNPQNIELNKEYTLKVTLASDTSLDASGVFIYVPFKFKADDQLVIAGKPKPVDVSVVGCSADGGGETFITNYSGTPTVSHQLTKPASGGGELTFAPELEDGVATESTKELTFDNSGILNVTLEDSDFDCTGLDDCPIEGGGVLKGSFVVKSRPWTFAICEPTDESGNVYFAGGDSEGGEKFVAAGEVFGLQVKPIIWQEAGSETESVEVSGYCDVAVTTNFFLTDAPEATLALDSELATPAAGNPDVVMFSASTLQREHTEKSSGNYYAYSDLSWQEVGSLRVTADAVDSYLDMAINQGYREIGRFYPHHFKLENDNDWDYETGHDGFAYMNQPISMDYTVKAKSATDSDTENYGDFAGSLKASFILEAREIESVFGTIQEGDSLTGRIDMGGNQASSDWDKASYQFIANDFAFLKNSSTESGYTSIPDGPYNSSNAVFGVAVNDSTSAKYANEDKVNFDKDFSDTDIFTAQQGLNNIAVAFFSQPDFRYGRMVLDAVSGPIGGPISVPLRVEYWDDSNFVVNEDDNGSQFKTDIYYVMSNVSGGSAILTSDNSSSFVTVSSGRSSQVKAKQESSTRETVRLFLRQGNESVGFGNNPEPKEDDDLNETVEGWSHAEDVGQPWLQFNWRNKGDEDPSTVVNFGAYRGNDRIIYRGEPNLTGK